jgi:outer membrane protein assembly factor BamB
MTRDSRARWALAVSLLGGAASAADALPAGRGVSDWPMWGGAPDRNMVSDAKGLPAEWDVRTKKNVKWVAALGSVAYGNPVVAGGTIYVGTNNDGLRDPKQAGDRGVVLAFRAEDGELLWQMTHAKLASGAANDWPHQGVASSPLVEGDRVYYVSNRAELVCLDAEGFRDGENDGPMKGEASAGERDGDVVWILDMIAELGTFPHNLANSSPVAFGNLVYVGTSNGHDESHAKVPSPETPALIAVDKATGKVVWQDNSVFDRILHGQWSSPAVARVGDVDQVISGQGDGWVRGYEARTGKKLWEFDTNPKDAVWPKTRNDVLGTPVVQDGIVYIANGQDPEYGEGVGHLYAIDARKRGDITSTGLVWHYDKIRRSISTAAVKDGVVYYPDFSGFLHALDAKTGAALWTHDMFAAVWGSPLVADGRVHLGDEDGDVAILAAGREKKVIGEMSMGSTVYSTPVAVGNVLYIVNRNQLVALAVR